MKVTKNYQLFIDNSLYNVYNKLAEATKIVKGLQTVKEEDFTYEIIVEVSSIKVLRTGTKTEDFSRLSNNTIKKTRAKKKAKKIKKETKGKQDNTDNEFMKDTGHLIAY